MWLWIASINSPCSFRINEAAGFPGGDLLSLDHTDVEFRYQMSVQIDKLIGKIKIELIGFGDEK